MISFLYIGMLSMLVLITEITRNLLVAGIFALVILVIAYYQVIYGNK